MQNTHLRRILATFTAVLSLMALLTFNINITYAAGELQWADPTVVRYTDGNIQPKVVRASDGNYIVVWVDDHGSGSGKGYDVYAQKISSTDGSGLWSSVGIGTEGVLVTDNTGDQPMSFTVPSTLEFFDNFDVLADESGGAIIVFAGADGSGSSDIFAQRLNSSGVTQWPSSGSTTGMNLSGNNTAYDELPTVISDGTGSGAYVVWQGCDEDITCNSPTAELTRIDSSTGAKHASWNPTIYYSGVYDHVEVSKDDSGPYQAYKPRMALSASNSVIVAFMDLSSSLRGQRMNADGTHNAGWKDIDKDPPPTIIALKGIGGGGLYDVIDYEMTSDSSGNALIGYRMWDGSTVSSRVNKVDAADASLLWNPLSAGVLLRDGETYNLNVKPDGSNGMLYAWSNSPEDAGDIFVQKIDSSGTEIWTSGGTTVSETGFLTQKDSLSNDGAGGAIITWGVYDDPTWSIIAQRILADETYDWGLTGLIMATGFDNLAVPYKALAGDGSGGAVVVYEDYTALNGTNINAQFGQTDGGGGGGCTPSSHNNQCASLALGTGGQDIYFNGYSPTTAPNSITLTDDLGATISASTFPQDVFPSYAANTIPWGNNFADAFIGVFDLSGSPTTRWNLDVQGPAELCTDYPACLGTGGEHKITLDDTNFFIATHGTAWGTGNDVVTLTDGDTPPNQIVFDNNDSATLTQDVYYFINPSSSYTFDDGDMLAAKNKDTALNNATTYTEGNVSAPDVILTRGDIDKIMDGIWGLAVSYHGIVAGSTAPGLYTGEITYTLNITVAP